MRRLLYKYMNNHYISVIDISEMKSNIQKVMSGILAKKTTSKPASVYLPRQTQVISLEEAKEGDKKEIVRIMTQNKLLNYGMTTKLSMQDINIFSADQLYELAYGGSIDYWKSPVFLEEQKEEINFVSSLTREVEVSESIYQCPACGYNRILVRQEQKGGGDESMTAMFRCTRCGRAWSNSGRG